MRSHAVPVLVAISFALLTAATARSQLALHGLTQSGQKMTLEEKETLESHVSRNPRDIDARTRLLGYYFLKGRQDTDAASAKRRHVLWLIENAPESEVAASPYAQIHAFLDPEGYVQARDAWKQAIQESPDNLKILGNAAAFVQMQDRKLAEELLLKGQTLDSRNPHWPSSLGRLYSLGLISLPAGLDRKAAAEKAYRHFEKAFDLSAPMQQDALLSDLAKTALAAGLNDDARAAAEKMLKDNEDGWNQGNRTHHGNLILGRIALAEGNVAEAKSRLLLAGQTSGSPQLNSFGPNMTLAKELLERGEKDVVLEYFALCGKFWKPDRGQLDRWTKEVKADLTPEFGGNLTY